MLVVAVYIASVTNFTFWSELFLRIDLLSIQGFSYSFTTFLIIVWLLSVVFFVLGQGYFIKPVLIIFLMLSSVLSYFNQELGVIFDKEMIRNIVENISERNINEAKELLSYSLLLHVFIFGIIPSAFILLVNIKSKSFGRELISRSLLATIILTLVATTFMLNYKYFTYFFRENEDLLVYVTPVYPLVAVKKYIKRRTKNNNIFHEIGDDAYMEKAAKNRVVGIMVVGETARADHFYLNGYQRQTNPVLSKIKNIINFKRMYSCGTSTAYSVPCMFSFIGQKNYSPEKAEQYSNVLDVLTNADVKVVWVENNSSCKGVCKRIDEVNFLRNPDSASEYYNDGQYYDEVLIESFNDVIKNSESDILLVLHTMGSHGPLYYKRFPDSFAKFNPYCKKSSPQECNNDEIINAYDNTIYYTDYFLGLVIEYLEQNKKDYSAFMMYVSDHGESLGENGVYLHGLPFLIAPDAQIHVPFLIWFSDGFIKDKNINLNVVKQYTNIEYTHDNLSHTLLGLFGIKTRIYDANLDIIH